MHFRFFLVWDVKNCVTEWVAATCFESAQWSHFQGSTVHWSPDVSRRPWLVLGSHSSAPHHEYLVRTRANPVWFVVDKVALAYVFLRVLHFFPPVSIIPPLLHTHPFIHRPPTVRCDLSSWSFSIPLSRRCFRCFLSVYSADQQISNYLTNFKLFTLISITESI